MRQCRHVILSGSHRILAFRTLCGSIGEDFIFSVFCEIIRLIYAVIRRSAEKYIALYGTVSHWQTPVPVYPNTSVRFGEGAVVRMRTTTVYGANGRIAFLQDRSPSGQTPMPTSTVVHASKS